MKPITIFLLMLFASGCTAQTAKCYVDSLMGDAYLAGKEKPVALRKGSLIFDNDIIIIKKSCRLKLLSHDNKFITISKPGKYGYADLEKIADISSTKVSTGFFNFLWEDLLKPVPGQAPISSSVIGGVIGGVKRGDCDPELLEPIDGSKLDDDTVFFRWHALSNVKCYQLRITDLSGREFVNIVTCDTLTGILKRNLLKGGNSTYNCEIIGGHMNSSNCKTNFTVVSPSEKQIAMNALVGGNIVDGDFFRLAQAANTLGSNGWYKEAAEYYNRAMEVLRGAKNKMQ